MMRNMILCFFIVNLLVARPLQAGVLASAMKEGVSAQFQGYYYEVYEFEKDNSEDGFAAVLSSAFDAYLILIDPAGDLSINDDNGPLIELPGSGPRDAALVVHGNSAGHWLAIATTYGAGEEGDYTLRHDGVTALHRVDQANIDVKQVEKAFGERGVLSDAARQRREQEERLAKIEALVEQLSLRSYRQELKHSLRTAISRETDSYADYRHRSDELEQREKAVQDALVDMNRLTKSKALISELLDKELESVRSRAESQAADAVDALGKREAFAAALEALDRLDSLATRLQRAEADLLSAKTAEEVAVAQERRRRLSEELAALSAEIAEKLLDSEIVIPPRFGGFSMFWERVPIFSYMSWGGFLGAAASMPSPPEIPEIKASVWLPSLLPWPPPDASARAVIDPEFFEDLREGRTLGDINETLIEALVKAGYHGSSYLGVPHGFAIVTRLEQTDGHGAPLSGEARWMAKIQPIKSFSIIGYIRALLTSPPGYFRVISLVVSNEPFSSSGARMQLNTLERWSRTGLNVLPREIQALPYTEDYRVTALVYEFEKNAEHDQPEVHIPGRLSAVKHFERTRFSAFFL